MSAPIVYRWDDIGAPVARGQRGSLCDILIACLVTGYGVKSAAGWTLEYINTTFDKAVFRNNPASGTGFFLQVDGEGAANAYTHNVKAYEVMTSISDGFFSFYDSVMTAFTSNTATTTARPWILIADDQAFYFWCWTGITATPTAANYVTFGMFFGDLVPKSSEDGYACALSGCSNMAQGAVGYLHSPSAALASSWVYGLHMPRRSNGVSAPVMAALIRGGGPGADLYAGAFGDPYLVGGQIFVTRPHVNDALAYTLRGWLPGYYYPCHPVAFDQFELISSDGKTFLSLRHNVYNVAGNSFISLDDWRV